MSTNIIESKKYIPWVLRQSRDVQALCKILDLLINDCKLNIDYWVSLIDFDSCPDRLLPLLASYVGYKYDYAESYSTNRLIMKHYPEMIRFGKLRIFYCCGYRASKKLFNQNCFILLPDDIPITMSEGSVSTWGSLDFDARFFANGNNLELAINNTKFWDVSLSLFIVYIAQ